MDDIVLTILLLNPVYVTAFWAIVLSTPVAERNRPAGFLGKLMMVAFVLYMSHMFYFLKAYDVYIWLDCFYHLASLSVYPMYYIYVRLLVRDERFTFRQHGKYFIAPGVVFVTMALGYISMPYEKDYIYISEAIYGIENSDPQIRRMLFIQLAERVVFTVQTFVYAVLTYRIVSGHHELLGERYSFTEKFSIRWVQVFNATFFVLAFSSVFMAVLGRERFIDSPLRLAFPSFVFSVTLFLVGVLGNRQRPVRIEERDDDASDDPTGEKIPARLREDLEKLFRQRKIYLKKDLTIWDVTDLLATNRTYVSRIINHEYGLTFTQYVNNFRVEHARELMEKDNSTGVDEVAEISGFGSANSLYRAFLAKEKIPLAEFRKTLKSRRKGKA